jgi:hypothetical protein
MDWLFEISNVFALARDVNDIGHKVAMTFLSCNINWEMRASIWENHAKRPLKQAFAAKKKHPESFKLRDAI